ncbi:hypothetical protein SAMN02745213_01776 [Succinivibrio dextrinosolvens DSM 3072]|uniref:Lipoprotein n=1 Tax=Succinivibrio dextrinosolvens DSM 3072 TaxID=1123324 RepID=A0A1T4VMT5_9GAMM|nr:hypothetical protein [Succinivibrio dextrinosolvens]SKA66205.1 hypothetical protein SAMN02745213_01776 [Succinivibrio dextrinosolvens DSM 3072]
MKKKDFVLTCLCISLLTALSACSQISDLMAPYFQNNSRQQLNTKKKIDSLSYEQTQAYVAKIEKNYTAKGILNWIKSANTNSYPLANNKCRIYLPTSLLWDLVYTETSRQGLNKQTSFYWDGNCKNGFATGEGRLVTLGESIHFESITSLQGTEDDRYADTISYDFVNSRVHYSSHDKTNDKLLSVKQIITPFPEFSIKNILHSFDKNARIFNYVSSPFSASYSSQIIEDGVEYVFNDNTYIPLTSPNDIQLQFLVGKSSSPTANIDIQIFENFTYGSFVIGESGLPEEKFVSEKYIQELFDLYNQSYYEKNTIQGVYTKLLPLRNSYHYNHCEKGKLVNYAKTKTTICNFGSNYSSLYLDKIKETLATNEQLLTKAKNYEQAKLIEDRLQYQRKLLEDERTIKQLESGAISIFNIALAVSVGKYPSPASLINSATFVHSLVKSN